LLLREAQPAVGESANLNCCCSVDKVCEEVFSPEDADEEVAHVKADLFVVVYRCWLNEYKRLNICIHVAQVEDQVSQHVSHDYNRGAQFFFHGQDTICPGILSKEDLRDSVVTVEGDEVGELDEVLQGVDELFEVILVRQIILPVDKDTV